MANDLTSSSTVVPFALMFISHRCSELSVQNVTSRPCFMHSMALKYLSTLCHITVLNNIRAADISLFEQHGCLSAGLANKVSGNWDSLRSHSCVYNLLLQMSEL